jgi:FMN-dependent NADH-azoreductase
MLPHDRDCQKDGAPMRNLLHLDTSIRPSGSTSRLLSAAFADEWRRVHPGGGYVYRDLAVDPVPHLTHAVREYLLDPAGEHQDLPQEERAAADRVIADVHWATTILLGIPMYNYSVPSTLKAWLDVFVLPSCLVEFAGDDAPLKGKSLVAVTARGNAYSAGTGNESRDLQEPYIRSIFAAVGIDDVHFVHAEMTMAKEMPFLADYRPLADQSMAAALAEAKRVAGL